MTLSNFNWLDYVFTGVFVFLVILSLLRGLVKEIISIIAWVAGIYMGIAFAPELAAFFSKTDQPTSTVVGVCFSVLLIGALIIGAIINYFVTMAVQATGLGVVNRFLGGIFGFIKAFALELAVVFFVQLTAYAQDPIWQKSEFVNAYQPVLASLETKFGPDIQDLKEKMLPLTKRQ